MRLEYPALFSKWENGVGYTVEFPDLQGCVTEGSNLEEALKMAEDAASGWILGELEDRNTLPIASVATDIPVSDVEFVLMVVLDIEL